MKQKMVNKVKGEGADGRGGGSGKECKIKAAEDQREYRGSRQEEDEEEE